MFNTQLKLYRESLKLSQEKVATLLGLSQQAYAHYENGKREPSLDTLRKICKIFDCSADELLEIDK